MHALEHHKFDFPRLLRVCSICVVLTTTVCRAQESQNANESASALLSSAARHLSVQEFEAAAADALAAAKLMPDAWQIQHTAAQIAYRAGRAVESVDLFNRAQELNPRLDRGNWQRGIALATVGKFDEGADQFRIHHKVNPNDVENSAWYFLCLAKTKGIEAARAEVIPSQGDPRPPMMEILKMLKGQIEPEEVIEAVDKLEGSRERNSTALFYAELYVGLYFDSLGDQKQALHHLEESLRTDSEGYMFDTARVYRDVRFSEQPAGKPEDRK